jgi:hypothetical protein
VMDLSVWLCLTIVQLLDPLGPCFLLEPLRLLESPSRLSDSSTQSQYLSPHQYDYVLLVIYCLWHFCRSFFEWDMHVDLLTGT